MLLGHGSFEPSVPLRPLLNLDGWLLADSYTAATGDHGKLVGKPKLRCILLALQIWLLDWI
jgi:hypothetical protein